MLRKRGHFSSGPLSTFVVVLGFSMLSACAPTASTTASNSSSGPAPAEVIAHLQQAKASDDEILKDLTLYPNRREDVLTHEAAATQAIKDLQYGYPVDPTRLAYALEVPPRHLTAAEKTALIQQLQDAIKEDEAREQAVVAYSTSMYNEAPNAPVEFGHQESLAQKVIKQLVEGEHVSWDEVQRALYVPPNPL
jgi:hypothetical protein